MTQELIIKLYKLNGITSVVFNNEALEELIGEKIEDQKLATLIYLALPKEQQDKL